MTRPLFEATMAIAILAATLWAPTSFAQSAQVVRGEIVSIDADDGRGTVTIEAEDTGARQTFQLSPDTDIDVDMSASNVYSRAPVVNEFSDLTVGDTVRLELQEDVTGAVAVRSVRREQSADDPGRAAAAGRQAPQPAQTAADAERSFGQDDETLPSTGTAMPTIAAAGVAALMLAALIQGFRTRRRPVRTRSRRPH